MPKNVPTIESQLHSECIVTDCVAAPLKEASLENAGTPEERNALLHDRLSLSKTCHMHPSTGGHIQITN